MKEKRKLLMYCKNVNCSKLTLMKLKKFVPKMGKRTWVNLKRLNEDLFKAKLYMFSH